MSSALTPIKRVAKPIVSLAIATAGQTVGIPFPVGLVAANAALGAADAGVSGKNVVGGLVEGGVSGAGQAVGANFLGDTIGSGLSKVLPQLPDAALSQNVIANEGLGEIIGRTGTTDELLAALTPGQSTGLFGLSSNKLGARVGGLIGGSVAGTVANQLIQGGGPPPTAPPQLPANLGPRPAAPHDLQQLVVKSGNQTLLDLLRRR